MQRSAKNFRDLTITEEEANAFLDELFTTLFDNDDLSENTDKIPDLSLLDR